jgi:hypothetical protein
MTAQDLPEYPEDYEDLQPGVTVEHRRFGVGKVLAEATWSLGQILVLFDGVQRIYCNPDHLST